MNETERERRRAWAQAERELVARRTLPSPAERKAIRTAAGMTEIQLARVLGVSRVAVNRWESGRRTPRGQMLVDYVKALDKLAELTDGR